MTPEAQRVRFAIYDTFAREGRAPSLAELGSGAAAALRELHELHAIVLTDAGDAIRMAHPFSAWPMSFVVRDGDELWWGGCAWDSFGIVAALGRRLEILTRCPGCGTQLAYAASPEALEAPEALVVRLPRPAAEWWDDVVATCSHIRAYCSAACVDVDGGCVVPAERMWRLALPWYGDRLQRDWHPLPRERKQALLDDVGLTGPFWTLP